jgi:hypothetical protein
MLGRWMASLLSFVSIVTLTHHAFADDKPAPETQNRPTKATLEGGGIAVQGVDATGTGTSGGGGYVGAAYWFGGRAPLFARYTVSASTIIDRVGRPAGGTPIDTPETAVRHTVDLGIGYRLDLTHGDGVVWLLPHLGPRAMFLVDSLAPLWAIELGGGLRAGITVRSKFELSGLIAYDVAVAKTDAPATVYGAPLGELRFGGEIKVTPTEPFALTLGYEGILLSLDHQQMSFHQILGGVAVRFD